MVPKVLVIEPYADLRMEIAAILRRAHFVCDTAATAEAAAVELDQRAYAFVVGVVDTMASLASTFDPSSRLIVMTDSEARDFGGHTTLRKPFGRDELISRMN